MDTVESVATSCQKFPSMKSDSKKHWAPSSELELRKKRIVPVRPGSNREEHNLKLGSKARGPYHSSLLENVMILIFYPQKTL